MTRYPTKGAETMNWERRDYWESDQVMVNEVGGEERAIVAIIRQRRDGKYWWWVEYTDRPMRHLSMGMARHLRYAKEKAESEMQEIVQGLQRAEAAYRDITED